MDSELFFSRDKDILSLLQSIERKSCVIGKGYAQLFRCTITYDKRDKRITRRGAVLSYRSPYSSLFSNVIEIFKNE